MMSVVHGVSAETLRRNEEENSRLIAEQKAALESAQETLDDLIRRYGKPKTSWVNEHYDTLITLEGILCIVLGIVLAFLIPDSEVSHVKIMLPGLLGGSIALFLGFALLASMGITLYMVPFHILEFAKECWAANSYILKAIAVICFVIGWPLHYLVRILWHGLFLAFGTGIVFLVTRSLLEGCKAQ